MAYDESSLSYAAVCLKLILNTGFFTSLTTEYDVVRRVIHTVRIRDFARRMSSLVSLWYCVLETVMACVKQELTMYSERQEFKMNMIVELF